MRTFSFIPSSRSRLSKSYLVYILLLHVLRRGNHPICLMDHRAAGGSTIFSHQVLQDYLLNGHSVLYLVYDRKKRRINARAICQDISLELVFPSLDVLLHPLFPRMEKIFVNELINWNTPRNHFFVKRNGYGRTAHLGVVLRQIVRIAAEHKAGLEFVVHDFYPICPSMHLMNTRFQFCDIPKELSVCRLCIPTTRRYWLLNLNQWRKDWQYFFDNADLITFFSKNSLQYMTRVFNFSHGAVRVVPHQPLQTFPQPVSIPCEGPMVVAVVGSIDKHKGADIVVELAQLLLKKDNKISIVVIGTLEAEEIPDNITMTGAFIRQNLPHILEKYGCTIGFISSIWPETFSYVTQELMQLELPLVCLPLGAPYERIAAWNKGLPARGMSAQAVADALLELDACRKSARATA